jgi:hypothetical protein
MPDFNPTDRCGCGAEALLTEESHTSTNRAGESVTYQMLFYRCSSCGDEYLTAGMSRLDTARFREALAKARATAHEEKPHAE